MVAKKQGPGEVPVTLESLQSGQNEISNRVSLIMMRFEDASRGVANEQRLEATIHELEAKVADQAMQIARMEGYLDRVEEDDQARDGFVEVEQAPQAVPVRPPRMRSRGEFDRALGAGVAMTAERPRPRRRYRWSEDR